MKKLILSALMLLSCEAIFAGEGDMYLFWMIGTDATYNGSTTVDLSGYKAKVSNGSSDLFLDIEDTGTFSSDNLSVTDVTGLDTLAVFSGDPSSYSFFVELYNDAVGSTTYRSESKSYDDLLPYISSMQDKATPADTYAFKTFRAVPEPTSGLLLLLGIAGLALKRKRA